MIGNTNAKIISGSGIGTEILNVFEFGTLTNNDGIYSGFSSSDYLKMIGLEQNQIKFKDFGAAIQNSATWEMVFKIKYKTTNTVQVIFGAKDLYFIVHINASHKLTISQGNGSGSWSISDLAGTTELLNDTIYWTKVAFTGTEYKIYLSTDGDTWNLENSLNSNSTIPYDDSVNWTIGKMQDMYFCYSDIYIPDSYIKINENYWWKGLSTLSASSMKILNVVETGSLTRNDTVFSGFSYSNYLQLGNFVKPVSQYLFPSNLSVKDFSSVIETANSWEITMKIKYVAGGTADMQTLFCMHVAWGSQISIQTSSNKLLWQFSNSSGGSSISGGDEIGATTLVDGNTYWIKMEFTGTAYQVSLSTDGINFELEKTPTTSSTKLTNRGDWIIGTMLSDDRIFLGEIDIEDWVIKVNGNIWWQGVENL